MRIAHFSDLHVTADPGLLRIPELASKRLAGWLNLRVLGRFPRFRDAADVARAFVDDLEREKPDLVVFSGDVTGLALAREYAMAGELLRPIPARCGVIGIPGNHDLYVEGDARRGLFRRHLDAWLRSDLPDLGRVDGYPIVRLLGDRLAVVGVQASMPRPLWDSSGLLGRRQLDALWRALHDPRVTERVKIVCVHYAPRRASGAPDTRFHGLRDAEALLKVARGSGVTLIVHGHLHQRFIHPRGKASPVALACAGSLTDGRRERAYHLYDLDGDRLRVEVRRYDGASCTFRSARDAEGPRELPVAPALWTPR